MVSAVDNPVSERLPLGEPAPVDEPTDTRRRRDPEARPQQILEAAFCEFGEHGLAGARLDDIARRANVAKGTIYLYFPNKEALFREMVRTTTIAALETAEARLAAADRVSAEDQLRYFAAGWWEFLRTDRFQVVQRLVMAELPQFPDLMQFYADEVVARGRRSGVRHHLARIGPWRISRHRSRSRRPHAFGARDDAQPLVLTSAVLPSAHAADR